MQTRPYHHYVLIGAVLAIVYLNSLSGAFQFDDYNVIVDNGRVHSFSAWFQDLGQGIRPLLKLTYTINRVLSDQPFSFHLFNIIVHLINALLVYLLLVLTLGHIPGLRQDVRLISLGAALLFAVHPVQTEAVTYISGRSTSLMAMFYLGALLTYVHGTLERRPFWTMAVSPALFLAALCVKETALTLPFALLLWEKTESPRPRSLVSGPVIHWALAVLFLAAALLHPVYGSLLEYSFDLRGAGENLLTQVNALPYLMSKLILLNPPNIDPDMPAVSSLTLALALKAALPASMFLAGMVSARRVPWFAFGMLWFLIHLLPTNSLIPRLDVVNDRQLYLPSIGIFLIVSAGLSRLMALSPRRRWTAGGAFLAALLVLGSLTVSRNSVYRSEVALWEDTSRKSPAKARVHNNLGTAYWLAGRTGEARNAYLAALQLRPGYPLAGANLSRLAAAGHVSSSSSGGYGTVPAATVNAPAPATGIMKASSATSSH